MTNTRLWRFAALAWLAVVLAMLAHNYIFWQHSSSRIDADVLSLLPDAGEARQADDATRHLLEGASQEIIVLVGSKEWRDAQAAGDAVEPILKQLPGTLRYRVGDEDSNRILQWLMPYHSGLLDESQRNWLRQSDDAKLTQRAQAQLNQSFGIQVVRWQDDPFGMTAQWLLGRADALRVHPRDGRLSVEGEGRSWVMLSMHLSSAGFRLDGDDILARTLAAALAAARAKTPDAVLVTAGVPLHAEAAAVEGNNEMNIIGWGSLAGVLLLMWLGFRSLRPLLLVILSIGIGVFAGVSACALIFPKVHILTLIFGASLVGVAEDYGIHYFASRQVDHTTPPLDMMRHLAPGLWLALLTSVIAYAALALAPFPGLQQMALFSATGLLAAFLTALLWYPWLDGGKVRSTRFAERWADSRRSWPALQGRRGAWIFAAVLLVCAIGWSRLSVQDDIRALQNSPRHLIEDQQTATRLLDLPSPAQYIFVRGASADEVLAREEALKPRLASLVNAHQLGGWRAVSDWVPSTARQTENHALQMRARDSVWSKLADTLGLDAHPPALPTRILDIDSALKGPFGEALSGQWVGKLRTDEYASIVMLSDVPSSALPLLAEAAGAVPGAHFIDKPADISRLLEHYRRAMSWLALLGVILIWAALWWRYGVRSIRGMIPTLLGGGIALATLGFAGMPIQLFHILALFLVLGMGVDYCIFLLEHPTREDGAAWLAVGLGAASTLLSFGLLAISNQPALRAFGIMMAIGIAVVWLSAPMFCHLRLDEDDGNGAGA